MDSSVTMVRIYIHESERGSRLSCLQEVLDLLHDQQGVEGVTVLRGVSGFGDDGRIHASDMPRLNADLPEVISFFAGSDIVDPMLGLLAGIVPREHIVCWPAGCRAVSAGKR